MRLFILLLTFTLIATSCRKFEEEKVVSRAEPFVPKNLYPIERLPAYVNRVAVMPCYYPDPDSTLLRFADDIFNQELSQERIFETVRIEPSYLEQAYGEGRMSSSSALPEGFLKAIEVKTMANAILFIDLNSYQPYKPMSLSVRAKLVDIKSGEFHWAIDETFDTGHANVIVGASIFQEKAQVRALSQKTTGSVLHSPRSFTKYIASTVFSTLPMR
jgi:hypothetical protein